MRHVFVRVYLCKEAKMSLTIYQKIKKGVAFVTTADALAGKHAPDDDRRGVRGILERAYH